MGQAHNRRQTTVPLATKPESTKNRGLYPIISPVTAGVEVVEKPQTRFLIVRRLNEITLADEYRVRIHVGARYFALFQPKFRLNLDL